MSDIDFPLNDLPPATETLREEVRDFLAEELADYSPRLRAETWNGFSPDFSRKLGDRGWLGMTWPKQYGGHERSAFDRYVVCEELLAAGAPVAYHWIADRQSAPLLLRFGTEAQRTAVVPRVARGEICCCIGMSEPDSGSDLASLRTRAERTDDGWLINGRKVWTTYAHHAQYMIGLFRTTSVDPSRRHAGLTQFLVPMDTPGITVRPIINMVGEHHFNDITFEDVVLPESALIGGEGEGWAQVNAELAFERSGPERFLSSYQMLVELVRKLGGNAEVSDAASEQMGRLVTRLATLRRMSISVAGMLEAGESPLLESALVKSLGVELEQDLPMIAHNLVGASQMGDDGDDFEQVLGYLTQSAVSFSLRGGTPEIMKGIIARGLGLR